MFSSCLLTEGRPMLRKSGDKVRYCYRKALRARERALRATDSELREAFLMIEDRWMAPAKRFELAESLSDFGQELRRSIPRPTQKQRARLLRKAAGRWLREL